MLGERGLRGVGGACRLVAPASSSAPTSSRTIRSRRTSSCSSPAIACARCAGAPLLELRELAAMPVGRPRRAARRASAPSARLRLPRPRATPPRPLCGVDALGAATADARASSAVELAREHRDLRSRLASAIALRRLFASMARCCKTPTASSAARSASSRCAIRSRAWASSGFFRIIPRSTSARVRLFFSSSSSFARRTPRSRWRWSSSSIRRTSCVRRSART